jgi:hypothetical protein
MSGGMLRREGAKTAKPACAGFADLHCTREGEEGRLTSGGR